MGIGWVGPVRHESYSYLSSKTRLVFFSLRGRTPSSTTFTSGVRPILDLVSSATASAMSRKSCVPSVST